MSKTASLKDHIADIAPSFPFYAWATYLSHPNAPEGKSNYDFVGQCLKFSSCAAEILKKNGLEVMPMCTGTDRRLGPNHYFLLVRDPKTEEVVYYDPSGEQFGAIGAHKKAYTRAEIQERNRQCNSDWLENPILCPEWQIDHQWRDKWEEFESIRNTWGHEIHHDIPRVAELKNTVPDEDRTLTR